MNEKLISGYTAYTTADEYAASAVGDAPATTPWCILGLIVATAASGAGTVYSGRNHC